MPRETEKGRCSMILVDVIAAVCVVILFMALVNKRALKKFKSYFAALFGKAADDAIDSAPIAVYKEKLEQKWEELKHAMVALENHLALIKQIERELAAASGEYTLFEEKVKTMGEKSEDALRYANAMGKLEDRIYTLKTRLTSLKSKYDMLAKRIKELRGTYLEYKDKAKNLETDLEISRNEAEISNLFKNFDSNYDDLAEIESKIKSKIDKNESVSVVADDLSYPDLKAEIRSDLEAKKAKDILARYQTPQ